MPPLGRVDDAPPAFQRAVASLRTTAVRPEVHIEDIPAPQRLAPYATAMSATVVVNEHDVAFGRFIVLYDPEGTRDWPGPFRVVAYVSAELEPEIAVDPLIGQVAWTWLTEALLNRAAEHRSISGTVTRATSEGFGTKADEPATTELELRASWSLGEDDLSGHMAAWCELMCSAAGLPPTDVTDINQQRPT